MHLVNPDEIINIELFHQAEFGSRDLFLEIQKHRLEPLFLFPKLHIVQKKKISKFGFT